jgi:branched-subunit amino acid transport protein
VLSSGPAAIGPGRRAAAVGATIVILQAVPLLIHDNSHLPAVIAHALPFQAWNRLTAIPFNPVARAYPWTITGAWTVFAVWGLVAAVLAVAAVRRRDVLAVSPGLVVSIAGEAVRRLGEPT